jgi:hypothetical protein
MPMAWHGVWAHPHNPHNINPARTHALHSHPSPNRFFSFVHQPVFFHH